MATIRTGISDIVNDLIKTRGAITNPYHQVQLGQIIEQLMTLWRHVLLEQMDRQDNAYKNALVEIKTAKAEAKAAVKDVGNVVDAIKAATKAAKAIDKLVNLAVKII